jgi:hypothetical protein
MGLGTALGVGTPARVIIVSELYLPRGLTATLPYISATHIMPIYLSGIHLMYITPRLLAPGLLPVGRVIFPTTLSAYRFTFHGAWCIFILRHCTIGISRHAFTLDLNTPPAPYLVCHRHGMCIHSLYLCWATWSDCSIQCMSLLFCCIIARYAVGCRMVSWYVSDLVSCMTTSGAS